MSTATGGRGIRRYGCTFLSLWQRWRSVGFWQLHDPALASADPLLRDRVSALRLSYITSLNSRTLVEFSLGQHALHVEKVDLSKLCVVRAGRRRTHLREGVLEEPR